MIQLQHSNQMSTEKAKGHFCNHSLPSAVNTVNIYLIYPAVEKEKANTRSCCCRRALQRGFQRCQVDCITDHEICYPPILGPEAWSRSTGFIWWSTRSTLDGFQPSSSCDGSVESLDGSLMLFHIAISKHVDIDRSGFCLVIQLADQSRSQDAQLLRTLIEDVAVAVLRRQVDRQRQTGRHPIAVLCTRHPPLPVSHLGDIDPGPRSHGLDSAHRV